MIKDIDRDLLLYNNMVFSIEKDDFDSHILKLIYNNQKTNNGKMVSRCMRGNLIQLRDLLNEKYPPKEE